MKTLKRNRTVIWYALATGTKVRQTDANGRYTGETVMEYADPVKYDRLSAKSRQGIIQVANFGLADNYVDSFVTDDMQCPIAKDTRLWIDTEPYDAQGNLQPHTHVVRSVLPSLTVIRILAQNVSVST